MGVGNDPKWTALEPIYLEMIEEVYQVCQKNNWFPIRIKDLNSDPVYLYKIKNAQTEDV